MFRRLIRFPWWCALLAAVVATGCAGEGAPSGLGSRYEDLVALFAEWRTFQKPKLVDGVPDYSAPPWRHSTANSPTSAAAWPQSTSRGWPVTQQVDWHVVRAEMNGLDFDHRVLQPWANNPGVLRDVSSRRRATSPRAKGPSPSAPSSSGPTRSR